VVALSASARKKLAALENVNTKKDGWLEDAVLHLRNQTVHYGGRWNWDDVEWAMRQAGTEEGSAEFLPGPSGRMRFIFADTVASQHFTRRFPEVDADPEAELDREVLGLRFKTRWSKPSPQRPPLPCRSPATPS